MVSNDARERKMRRILMLLDTTVLWTDPWLEAPDVRALLTLSHHGVQVLIPNIVLLEQERHVREEVETCIKNTMRSLGKLSRLTGRMFPNPFHNFDSGEAAKQYAQEMRKRLETAGAIVPATPKVSHGELVDRAIHRKRPFDNAGRGYRDALIWYSAMEAIDSVEAGDDVQFICVTDNITDFGDKEGNLHSDLRDQVVTRRSDITLSASLARTVGEVWNEQLAWLAPRNPDLEEAFHSGKILGIDVKQWIVRHGAESLAGRSFGGSTTALGVSDQFGPVVFAINNVVSLESPQVRRLPNAEVHVTFSAVFNGLCDILQFRPQEDDEDAPRNPFCDDQEWTEVSTGTGGFQAHFSLLIDSDEQTVVASDGQPQKKDV